MTDARGAALWAARMVLLWLGGWLAARGVGDAELWAGLADVGAGALVALVGALWSWRARRAQLAAEPPQ
nr:hypothetical protein [uncultured Roseococcus sp.]